MVGSKRQLYQGGCRCGLFTYESQLTATQSAFKCNCSLCVKKGYLWVFPGQNNFKVLTGSEDKLTTYKFGPKKLSHKVRARRDNNASQCPLLTVSGQFCPRCGTSVLASTKGDDPDFDLALNVSTNCVHVCRHVNLRPGAHH